MGSGNQLQGMIQGFLLEDGTLTKPGAVQAIFLIASPALMIDKLGHGIEQAPGCPTGRRQLSTLAMALVE